VETKIVEACGSEVLATDACWQLLRSSEVGRLAVSITGHPDIFPLNYVVDGGSVVFRTAEGTKLAASVLGRAVAFEIDGYDRDRGEAWSVVIKGRATEIERMQDVFAALDLPLFPWHASPKHRFVRIEPFDISGRRFHVTGRPVTEGLTTGASREPAMSDTPPYPPTNKEVHHDPHGGSTHRTHSGQRIGGGTGA
jgi:uncharacterized protein